MKKNNFKYFVCICALLSVGFNPMNTFATTPVEGSSGVESDAGGNSSGDSNEPHVKYNPDPEEHSTTLDGQIGEWDPNRFEDIEDIEGHIPQEDEYYTISVTVPLDMEFMVLKSSYSQFGNFYSPTYSIKNNGTKTLNVRVKSFERDETLGSEEDTDILHVGKVVQGDGKVQMELKIGTLKDKYATSISKEPFAPVDLTEDLKDSSNNLLCELTTNEAKLIKFDAKKWEIPKYESTEKKGNASSEFVAEFEFSIKE